MVDEFLYNGPVDGPLLVLAHGAGAGSESDFMTTMAALLGEQGIRVARFNFSYMQEAIRHGVKRPPSPVSVLIEEYREVVTRLANGSRGMVIGGKSMGGRVASMLMQQEECPDRIGGCVCLGYPFHPPSKPESLRTAHLQALRKPLLVVQGERDALGCRNDVEGYALDAAIEWMWMADGDHDLKPRQRSGFTHHQHLSDASERVAGFIRRLTA